MLQYTFFVVNNNSEWVLKKFEFITFYVKVSPYIDIGIPIKLSLNLTPGSSWGNITRSVGNSADAGREMNASFSDNHPLVIVLERLAVKIFKNLFKTSLFIGSSQIFILFNQIRQKGKQWKGVQWNCRIYLPFFLPYNRKIEEAQ